MCSRTFRWTGYRSRDMLDAAEAEIPDLCEKIDRTGETSEEERKSLLEFAQRFLERNGN